MSSGATAEGLCTDWEGSGADKEGAGVSVGALPADVTAEVVTGTDTLTNPSYYEPWHHGRGPLYRLGGLWRR